jgi:diacylglycerol kinase (ATP)
VDAVEVRSESGEGSRWFAGALSAGFDALVSQRANRLSWLPAALRYNVAALLELGPYRARRYAIDLDGERWDVDAMLVTVANTANYGNGMQIAPDASTFDGLLDVVVVKPLPKLRFLLLFPKVYKGAHVDLPYVEIRRAARVRVAVGDGPPIVAYADGERLWPLPVTAEVRKGALGVLAAVDVPVDGPGPTTP